MIIGDLRHSISVLGKTIIKNEYGAETVNWVTKTTLRAGRKYIGGDKTVDNKEVFSSQRILFTTLYRSIITENDIILFQNKRYLIKSIAEIGFREGLQIDTELINE